MIQLNESMYIAQGAERKCYRLPSDNNKVIKVEYIIKKDRDQNSLDHFYYTHLQTQKCSFKHITRYYGQEETNYGQGSVFEAVNNYDGSISQTIDTILTEKNIPFSELSPLLEELRLYLKNNNIVFGDVALSNILYQKLDAKSAKLIIIDGLGARRNGFKLWFQMHCKLYNKLRIYKQWKKLIVYVDALR